jgi:hypothetical protein
MDVYAASGGNDAVGGFVVVMVGMYFVPLIVGLIRRVPNSGSIGVINVFLGWTMIGWVVALAMASRSHPPVNQVNVYGVPPGEPPRSDA